jgi:hypothetical protein
MKALLWLVLLCPLAAWADSPFDGTWVAQMDTASLDKKPYVVVIEKGMYENKSMVPPVKVKADGTDQPVKGHAYFDTLNVRLVGTDSLEMTGKLAGKVSFTNNSSVSPDGKTLTIKWSDQSGTAPATAESIFTRVKSGPAGSFAVSGNWQLVKIQNASANGQTTTYKVTADGVSMSSPTGQSYEAKFDGKEYPVAGDPGKTVVTVKRVNANTIVETDRRLGKVMEVDTMTVSADGKTMKVAWENPQTGRSGAYTMDKSP